ncbi:MAG: hypothetical protein JSS75_01655 [Bacteroidetes bacterium]|nr:hypothetical protein [Bacteroidota bacterium]
MKRILTNIALLAAMTVGTATAQQQQGGTPAPKPAPAPAPAGGQTAKPESRENTDDKRDALSKKLQERRQELKQERSERPKAKDSGDRKHIKF